MEEKKNNNILTIVLFVLLLIAVGVIGYLFGSNNAKDNNNNNGGNTTEEKENNQDESNNVDEEENIITPVSYTPKCANDNQQNLQVDIDENQYNNIVEYISNQQNVKITLNYCDENSETEIDGVAHFDLAEYTLSDSEKNSALSELVNKSHGLGSGGLGGGPCVPFTTISYTRNNNSYFIKYWGNIVSDCNDGNIYKIIDKTATTPESQEYCHYSIESLGSTINNITKYEI
ncbi:MAG: hypothetical protein IJY25_02900 [Bacilli bacterium]|nr:hypothetical protein [Bacilli bacterium]